MNTDMLRSRGYDPRGAGADRRFGNIPDTATRDAVADALEEARRAWRDWQDAWTGVQRAMRSAGMSTARIDAYRVGTGYDEGWRPVDGRLARRGRGGPPVTKTASSTSPEFDRLLLEAVEIAGRIHERLADGIWPEGLRWGDVGDMAQTVRELRAVSDRLFAEGRLALAHEGAPPRTTWRRTMNDQFDALLRERISKLAAAVPAEPAPPLARGRPLPGWHPVQRRLVLALSLGLVLLAALAVSLPTLSRLAFEAQARELGVPDGVEIVASGGDATELMFVMYRGADGREHCVGDCEGIEHVDRDGKVLYQGPPAPTATPNPRR